MDSKKVADFIVEAVKFIIEAAVMYAVVYFVLEIMF